jgi:ribonuclease P protein component
VTGTGRFTRADRLLHSREFQHVTRQGRRAASDAFVVLVAQGGTGGQPRLGVTVSRRVGNAVVRNRVKRRVREWFRRERQHLAVGIEVVVIARRDAALLSFQEGGRQLSCLVARAADAAA